jgi:hypothetical protein
MSAKSTFRMFFRSTTRRPLSAGELGSRSVKDCCVKNAWLNETYIPPRERVISQSTPASGASVYEEFVSARVKPPPLTPQNQASLN